MFSFILCAIISASAVSMPGGRIYQTFERSVHNNNNLWTALDRPGGDVGSVSGPSMQFPGGTGINTLFQGCQAIGFSSGANPVVVATQLC
ncbi:hypothetical protein JXL83_09850 [candidate division WOR-3 bacterium]|nr:hypothetical protein [candidate division WOR-3 bacterium]